MTTTFGTIWSGHFESQRIISIDLTFIKCTLVIEVMKSNSKPTVPKLQLHFSQISLYHTNTNTKLTCLPLLNIATLNPHFLDRLIDPSRKLFARWRSKSLYKHANYCNIIQTNAELSLIPIGSKTPKLISDKIASNIFEYDNFGKINQYINFLTLCHSWHGQLMFH